MQCRVRMERLILSWLLCDAKKGTYWEKPELKVGPPLTETDVDAFDIQANVAVPICSQYT